MHDIVIVGGGPGGYAAALYAENFGLSVALIDEERPGGTCLIRGCIPAKQWLYIAEVFSTVSHAAEFGVVTEQPTLDWEAALARKTQTVEGLVRGLGGLLKKKGVEVITGYGRLAGPGKVEVETDEGKNTIEGRAVILASGSYSRTIPGYDFDGEKIVSSDHALDWPQRPNRVAIVGGGVIGCEFASFLVDVGTEVHVFEVMDQIIPGSDAEASKQLQRQLQKRGVKFHIGVGVDAPKVGETVVVPFGDDSVEVDVVLVSVGRGPRTDDVGLDTVSAKLDRGFVEVDLNTMQTAQPGLYAVGDIVAGTPQLAHVGFAEGIAAVTHIGTGKARAGQLSGHPQGHLHPSRSGRGRSDRGPSRRARVGGGVGEARIQRRGPGDHHRRQPGFRQGDLGEGRPHRGGCRRRPAGGRVDSRTHVFSGLGGSARRGGRLHPCPPELVRSGRRDTHVRRRPQSSLRGATLATTVSMPQLGETVTEGTILRWAKQVGDTIAEDEVLVEISTDKVDTEVPSPAAGTILEILVNEGDTVSVGTPMVVIGAEGEAAPSAEEKPAEPETPEETPAAEEKPAEPEPTGRGAEARRACPGRESSGRGREGCRAGPGRGGEGARAF